MVNIKTDGTKQTSITEWGIEPELRYFTLSQGTAQPWVKTWYDARGRKVRTESRGEGNVTLLELATYNKKGQVTANVVSNGDLTTSESYTYDNYNRIETEVRKVDDDTMQFGYSYNSQGLLQSTVYPGNVTVGYAYDGYGKLVSLFRYTPK